MEGHSKNGLEMPHIPVMDAKMVGQASHATERHNGSVNAHQQLSASERNGKSASDTQIVFTDKSNGPDAFFKVPYFSAIERSFCGRESQTPSGLKGK